MVHDWEHLDSPFSAVSAERYSNSCISRRDLFVHFPGPNVKTDEPHKVECAVRSRQCPLVVSLTHARVSRLPASLARNVPRQSHGRLFIFALYLLSMHRASLFRIDLLEGDKHFGYSFLEQPYGCPRFNTGVQHRVLLRERRSLIHCICIRDSGE